MVEVGLNETSILYKIYYSNYKTLAELEIDLVKLKSVRKLDIKTNRLKEEIRRNYKLKKNKQKLNLPISLSDYEDKIKENFKLVREGKPLTTPLRVLNGEFKLRCRGYKEGAKKRYEIYHKKYIKKYYKKNKEKIKYSNTATYRKKRRGNKNGTEM